jgi:acyl-CoA synthetase (AMP-forming)/AMP-acid ligase II
VVGVSDPTYGEVIAAVVVPSLSRPATGAATTAAPIVTVQTVRGFLQDRLAPYKHPRVVRVVDAIPRNQLGKVTLLSAVLMKWCCLFVGIVNDMLAH